MMRGGSVGGVRTRGPGVGWLLLAAPLLFACSGDDDGKGGVGSGVGSGARGGGAGTGALGVGGRAGQAGGGGTVGNGGAPQGGSGGASGKGDQGGASGASTSAGQSGSAGAAGQAGKAGAAGNAGQGGATGGQAGASAAAGEGGSGGAPECVDATMCNAPTCRVPTCVSGVCGDAPAPELTPCVPSVGTGLGVCAKDGFCYACLTDAQCAATEYCFSAFVTCAPRAMIVASDPPNGDATGRVRGPISITFDKAMSESSFTPQAVDGPCAGSVQISYDDFATCIGIGPRVLTSGGKTFEMTPQHALYARTDYKLRTTKAITTTDGVAARDDVAVSFRTRSDSSLCNESLSIAAVVLGGIAGSGAPMKSDLILLKSRSAKPTSLAGASLQIGPGNPTGPLPWVSIALPSAIVPPHGYFLVETDARGAAPGEGLPAGVVPDFSLPATLAFVQLPRDVGRIAFMSGTGAPLEKCPTTDKIDFLGYGGVSACGEGPSAFQTTMAPSNGIAFVRNALGCADIDRNSDDFVSTTDATAIAAALHDGTDPPTPCVCGGLDDAPAALFVSCKITSAPTITVGLGQTSPAPITAELTVTGYTNTGASSPALLVQGGYGRADENPEAPGFQWTWQNATSTGPAVANTLVFQAPPLSCGSSPGTFHYGFRASLDGIGWQYCDVDGAGASQPFRIESLGTLVCQKP